MQHPDPLRAQAYFDGEVDAVSAADIERHLEQCGPCRAQLQALEQTRGALREQLSDYRAPEALRLRIDQALDRRPGPARTWSSWSFWMGSLCGGGFAAAAVVIFAFIFWVPRTQLITDALVSAHVRSLMSSHPIDVISTDKHTVKPWFTGHADVSPVVADFESEGYRLAGGRADYLQHQRVAVLVYQHGAHLIDVFSWSAATGALPGNISRDGYHLDCWQAADLNYCAVSDAGWNELKDLERLLHDQSARELR